SVRLWEGARGYPEKIKSALNELQSPLSKMPGVIVENKGPVASIHYRLAPDPEAAQREILQVLKGSSKVKELGVSLGRMVVELKPPLRVNKGFVLRELVENNGLRGAICLGDDVTDLDAFSAIREAFPGRPFIGVAIAVEDAEILKEVKEGADYSLRGVREVERFLEWLDTDPGYTSTRHRPAHE
ncbi:MAG: trehalose-phosphatase, partial [Dehalococcoidia bacterium]